MSLFLYVVFVFFIGSSFGYVLELLYRRIVSKKWVNPGLLIGPYLPIYGFGLCILTMIYIYFSRFSINSLIVIFLMGISMTLIELIGGLIFVNSSGIKLWDYSTLKWNFKGIICPQFTIIWTILGAIYYYFLADSIVLAIKWFDKNLSFSFVLGIFFGVVIIDYIYSTNVLIKITKFAKDNSFIVKYEELKKHIIDIQESEKKKYSFLFPFKQTKSLIEYLNLYKDKKNGIKKFTIFGIIRNKKK